MAIPSRVPARGILLDMIVFAVILDHRRAGLGCGYDDPVPDNGVRNRVVTAAAAAVERHLPALLVGPSSAACSPPPPATKKKTSAICFFDVVAQPRLDGGVAAKALEQAGFV